MPLPVITESRSPRLDLPYLFPGQSQKEAFVNEAIARLDALVQPGVVGVTASPPGAPVPGECHIVGPSADGNWAGHSGDIAVWAQTQWLFTTPLDGAFAFDRSAHCLLRYDAADGWRRAEAPAPVAGGAVQDSEVRAALAATVAALQHLGILTS